jgi:glycosyltransferase involved in cell wall biosynthesis
VNFYQRNNIDYTIIEWDRKDEVPPKEHYDYFRFKAGFSVGGIKGIINNTRWMIFVYKYIKAHPAATTIHACDLNTAFPAALYKRIHNKNLNVIFDVGDWFSANFAHRRFARRISHVMEKFTCKWANNIIICEPEREEQISFKIKQKPLVLRNIPEINESESLIINEANDKYKFDNDWPTLVYFGGLVESRYLDEVFNLARTEKFNMLVGGCGSADREALCQELNKLPNFRYFGRMKTREDGLQMSNSADIIYAMYCKDNLNHIHAAPNKHYEAMFLGKPVITTKGTLPEKRVVENNIGWVIEENIEELTRLLRSIDDKSIKEKGQNAKKLWNEKYKDEVSNFFNEVYAKIIK